MNVDSGPDEVRIASFRTHVVFPVVSFLLRTPAHRLLSDSVLLLGRTSPWSAVPHDVPTMFARSDSDYVVIADESESDMAIPDGAGHGRWVDVNQAGRRLSCWARVPEAGSIEHHLAQVAYHRRYPQVPVVDSTPLLVLTPEHQLHG
jgi:hypothetical protein